MPKPLTRLSPEAKQLTQRARTRAEIKFLKRKPERLQKRLKDYLIRQASIRQ